MIKRFIKNIFIFMSRIVFSLLYDGNYLQGRWFESTSGWRWCWKCWWDQKIKGYNRHIPFPVHPGAVVGNIENISFHLDNIDNFWKNGCYFQCWTGKIIIGEGTYIAQNVGLITENHDPRNLDNHLPSRDIVIGKNCWIGMNAVILPGVHLGDGTVVGAGAVVTKSFDGGTVAGVPAKQINTKYLETLGNANEGNQ